MSGKTMPTHIGIIMDGNRRWAKQRGLSYTQGYEAGFKALKELLNHIQKLGLKYLSVYAFSTENWQRPGKQVDWLMKFISQALDKELQEILKRNLRLVFLGDHEHLSARLQDQLKETEELTNHNEAGTLVICFNYGGQQEIVHAVRQMIKARDADLSKLGSVDEESFAGYLYHPEVPPLDLIIRTSGEYRLSNFMLWRAAYSEFYFVDKHWPDFTAEDLDAAIEEYLRRQRRMGA